MRSGPRSFDGKLGRLRSISMRPFGAMTCRPMRLPWMATRNPAGSKHRMPGIASTRELRATRMPSDWRKPSCPTSCSADGGFEPSPIANGGIIRCPITMAQCGLTIMHMIAAGLARYGLKAQVHKVMKGLFDASLVLDFHRLPELFCGFVRRPGQGLTRYPVACNPQAWAAGSPSWPFRPVLGCRSWRRNAR